MKNRVIESEEDHRKALARIEELMDAKPGTTEMDELELLVSIVEVYEERHFPINRPDPIEALKFRMEQMGLSGKAPVPRR